MDSISYVYNVGWWVEPERISEFPLEQSDAPGAAAAAGDTVSLGQSGQSQTERMQCRLEQTLRARGCTMQDFLKGLARSGEMVSGADLLEFLQHGAVTPDLANARRMTPTQTQDTLTTGSGMRVDVTTNYRDAAVTGASVSVVRANGQRFTFEADGNVRLNERGDESLAVTFASTGETRLYAADGSVTVEQGAPGELSGTDGNDVFLQLTAGSTIDAGAGDDAIVVLTGGGATKAGAGNDTIIVGNAVAGATSLDAGDGNDTLRGDVLKASVSVEMGDGDDTVEVRSVRGNIRLGDGDNSLSACSVEGRVTAGDGDNTVNASLLSGQVAVGDGGNTLNVSSLSGRFTVGDGDNTVNACLVSGQVAVGDGGNTLNVNSLSGQVAVGGGNNTITAGRGSGNLVLGEGNNTITADSWDDGGITAGDGNNDFLIGSFQGNLAAGDGDNALNIGNMRGHDKTSISLGQGDNTVTARVLDGKVEMGDGDNILRWDWSAGTTIGASIHMGDGNNTVIGRDMFMYDDITLGNGDNTLELSPDFRGYTKSPSVKVGNGQNAIFLGEDRPHMELGAGRNTYLNESMTSAEIEARKAANDNFMNEWQARYFG